MSYYGFRSENSNYFEKKLKMDVTKKDQLNFTTIEARLNYSEPCIIQEHPVRSMVYDQELWNEIVRATPRPKYIRIAASWIRHMLFRKNEFAAIHWRYDKTVLEKKFSLNSQFLRTGENIVGAMVNGALAKYSSLEWRDRKYSPKR